MANAIAQAHRKGRPVIVGIGAHVVKVGLAPHSRRLDGAGHVTAVAMNGAGIIHDFELALMGHTSEEVDAEIDDGRFGMAEETGRILNEAIAGAIETDKAWAKPSAATSTAQRDEFPNRATSILATGTKLGIPVTVHVAIGTDIIHMHPSADGAAIGATSLLDFRRLAAVVARMEGGVYLNIGSAVVLPEVFLKTVSLGRNLGHPLIPYHHRQHGFPCSLSPAHQCRPPTDAERGQGLFAHRPS